MMRKLLTPILRVTLTVVLVLLMAFQAVGQEAIDVTKGEKLYKQNCAACHKIDKRLVGPALGGVTERRSEEWLLRWIRNNQELRESGDADAIAIFNEYNGSPMTAFPQFSDDEIRSMLAYVDQEWAAINAPAPAPADGVTAPGEAPVSAGPAVSLQTVLIGLSIFLALIIFILIRIKNMLIQLRGNKPLSLSEDIQIAFSYYWKNSRAVVISVIVLVIVALNLLWQGMLAVNVEQNYQPHQPINFSHKIHAGDNQIDCNYCHSSARHSKHSGIPSANVCMNCHMYVAEGRTEAGTQEIQKIYAAIGWDVEKREYIANYEQKPIEWVRIHNLPDLAYFNHSQHVTAGGVECQTCHGPVQEMDEVYQFSPLTMGWCINCHRETEVKMQGNEYYDKLHAQLAEQYKGEKITVSKIGGLECGKCHY